MPASASTGWPNPPPPPTNEELLERLVIDNPELDELESKLSAFNVFEAIGAVRQELRHSDFLAFLLDPNRTHGVGTRFLDLLLKHALRNTDGDALAGLSSLDLHLESWGEVEVRRESDRIDVLVIAQDRKLVILIENKVGSVESKGQLARYHAAVQQRFPGLRVLPFYLTPGGERPSDERYTPLSYRLIGEAIEDLLESGAATGADLALSLAHYRDLLHRHIIMDSDIAELCRKIYRKHRQALDLIFEHRPDLQLEIYHLLLDLIGEEDTVMADHSSKTYVRFLPREWDVASLKKGSGWTATGRILLLEFSNNAYELRLKATIGPGDPDVRRALHSKAADAGTPFKKHRLGSQWGTIYSKRWINQDLLDGLPFEEIDSRIRNRWRQFIEKELPDMVEKLDLDGLSGGE